MRQGNTTDIDMGKVLVFRTSVRMSLVAVGVITLLLFVKIGPVAPRVASAESITELFVILWTMAAAVGLLVILESEHYANRLVFWRFAGVQKIGWKLLRKAFFNFGNRMPYYDAVRLKFAPLETEIVNFAVSRDMGYLSPNSKGVLNAYTELEKARGLEQEALRTPPT